MTLVNGLTLVVSDRAGDIAGGHEGVIACDTRHISRFVLHVDGEPVEPLGASVLSPEQARFSGVAVTRADMPDAPLEVTRVRRVAAGRLTEEIRLEWWGAGEHEVFVSMEVDTDFADIFEIREIGFTPTTAVTRYPVRTTWDGHELRFEEVGLELDTHVRFDPLPHARTASALIWNAAVARDRPWQLRVHVILHDEDPTIELPALGEEPTGVTIASDPADFGRACQLGLADFDALSLPDELDPARHLTAAGIPWYVALFGRDTLIAAHQARAFLPGHMLDSLHGLAARQGRVDRPSNDEAPGKILHEVRLTPRAWLGEGGRGRRAYYGSVDSTALFLIDCGTARRWGASREALETLLPAMRAALGWLRGPGDADGDGLIEYESSGPHSLRNQGWKDSDNAVQFPDGSLAGGAIAVAEAQGYAYRGRRELAGVLRALGHDGEADEVDAEADGLRDLIRERFWIDGPEDGPGWFALALDGDKRQVASVASNMGHLLWCGVPTDDEAVQVARHLLSPELASGWGLRTLSTAMGGYNPISYHVGSVWPHDTAIACEGLRRYGLVDEAHALAEQLLDALRMFGLRLPELFGGHARLNGDAPIPYPTACRPQAWAAGVPLQLATLFLHVEPALDERRIDLSPALPPSIRSLRLEGIAFPTGSLGVHVEAGGATQVLAAPDGIAVEILPAR